MGNKTRKSTNETSSDLKEKDEKIAELERQVSAYNARASHTQTRLIATLDVLDLLQAKHMLEISSEQEAKERLSLKLDRYLDYVKAVESEKEDMRDAVEQLIQKVEVSNDMSSWPYSRMRISSLTEPVHHVSGVGENNTELLAYASGVIIKLRTERDLERKAHQETYNKATVQVAELEAKIAIREAELEACICGQQRGCTPQNTSVRDTRHKACLTPPKLTDEDCLRALSMTDVKNKALELELRELSERLEKARSIEPQEPQPHHSSNMAIQENSPDNAGSTPSNPQSRSNTNEPELPREGIEHPHTSIPSTAQRSALPLVESNQHAVPQDNRPSNHIPSPLKDTQAVKGLNTQLATLQSQVDALIAEKAAVVSQIAKKKRVLHDATPDDFNYVLVIEDECIQLASEVHRLEKELESCREAANVKETQILAKSETLRAQCPPPNRTLDVEPEDNNYVEQNMDLATPLIPSSIQPLSPLQCLEVATPTDVLLIPLPISPRSPSPTSLIDWSSPRSTHPPLPQQRSIQISEELTRARAQLQDNETLVSQLRTEIQELQRLLSSSGYRTGRSNVSS